MHFTSRWSLWWRDVTQHATWTSLLPNITPEVIVHLAAETGTGQSLTQASRHANVNVVGTTQMIDALTEASKFPRRIILASSRAVYGEGAWHTPNGEATLYPGQRSKAQLEREEWGLSWFGADASGSDAYSPSTNKRVWCYKN